MIKTLSDIEEMRVAGKLAAEVLEMITPFVKPGISTGELDSICHDYILMNKMPFLLMLDIEDSRKQFAAVLIKLFVMAYQTTKEFLKMVIF